LFPDRSFDQETAPRQKHLVTVYGYSIKTREGKELDHERQDFKATIWAIQSLDARISGSGSVKYYGSPTVDSSGSGSGKIRGLGGK
jgi:hypothetical protein